MPLYHGTRVGFKRGGFLMPPSFHNSPQRPGHQAGEEDYIYFTTSRELAEEFALSSRGRGRPKILTLEVYGDVERDPLAHEYDGEGYRARGHARVVDVEIVR